MFPQENLQEFNARRTHQRQLQDEKYREHQEGLEKRKIENERLQAERIEKLREEQEYKEYKKKEKQYIKNKNKIDSLEMFFNSKINDVLTYEELIKIENSIKTLFSVHTYILTP